uniref:Origin recognition complex subunit 4 n=1 Tax=Lygus hesperus TaxID=30085 RepID=A0A0A9VUK8_LYGHE
MVVLGGLGSSVREHLKERLMVSPSLEGLDSERAHLLNILKRSVCFGESDSLLVVGPRGTGKTLLVNTCLKDLNEDEECKEGYSVVLLSGLVHTDDNLALKDIIQQLHVDELEGDRVTGSFADNLLFVLQSLKSGDRKSSKPIIFVLDEFQLFCEHRNQTLLYNLFDVAQSAQAPICVVGVTCRVDITELLEKRVKSRFSHRQINLFYNGRLDARAEAIRSYLSLPSAEKRFKGLFPEPLVKKWNSSLEVALKDDRVLSLLERHLELDPSEKSLKNILFWLISNVRNDDEGITVNMMKDALSRTLNLDVKVSVLKDLSILELCLIIAIRHHCDIYEGEPFNFEMVLKQYMKFANQNLGNQVTQRPIIYKAFERIKDLELIQPVSGTSKGYKKEYQLYTFNLLLGQVNEAVNSFSGLPTDVAHWASSCMTS